MQIGLHVSIAGSIDKAVDNAVATGCTAFQIFTRNPRGWAAKPLTSNDASSFKEKLAKTKIDRFATVAHMPYLPNLSSPEKDPFVRSLDSLIDEVKRCSNLRIPYIVAHLGSHKGEGDKKGIEMLVRAFTKAAADTPDDVMILLENTAGQKNSVGSDLDQLASILSQLKPAKRFGICFDTCHGFVSGYDMSTEKGAAATLTKLDKAIGFENLKILHLNDSKGELGSNLDRHEHIGLGHIGEKGLSYIIKTINRKKIPIILETPIDERRDDVGNLNKAKELA